MLKNCLLGSFIIACCCSFFQAKAQVQRFYEIKNNVERYFENKYRNNRAALQKDGDYTRYKRWEWWAERHLDANGIIRDDMNLAFDSRNQPNQPLALGGNWLELAHSNFSTSVGQLGKGRVNCIAEIPGTPHILAGTAGGGVWRGDKYPNLPYLWYPITEDLPRLSVTDICINPTNALEMYIASGNGDDFSSAVATGYTSSGSYSRSMGILKSIDGGANWQRTNLSFADTPVRYIFRMVMDPANPARLYAATNNGIYSTTNGWQTFTRRFNTGSVLTDIKIKPGDGNTLFATGGNMVFRSTDGGENYTNIFTFPARLINGTNYFPERLSLAVTAANPNYLYVMGGISGIGYLGIYRCTQNTVTSPSFSLRSSSPDILGYNADGSGGANNQVFYDIVIAVHPQNAERVFAGGLNLWESTDGAANWTNRTDWRADVGDANDCHSDFHQLVFSGNDNNVLFNSNDGGLFIYNLSNNRSTFESNGINNTQYYRITTGMVNDGNYNGRTILGGTQDNGTMQWHSNALTKVYAGDGMDNAFASSDGLRQICSYSNGRIHVSDNGGNSFGNPLIPPAENTSGAWITPIVQHCSVPDLVYIGYKNIYSNQDAFFSWTDWSKIIPVNFPNPIIAMCQGNITNPAPGTNVIYCAVNMSTSNTADFHVFRVENDLASTLTDLGSVGNIVTGLACDPNDARYVYLTLGGVGSGQKVFYSSNKGQTFIDISGTPGTPGALPATAVNCIAIKGGGHTGIYVGTDIGVYHRFSWAGGQVWTLFSNGLPNVPVTDLAISDNTGEIFAATYGRGLWRSELYAPCQPEITVSGNSVGMTYYEASQRINSSTYTNGGYGSKITFNAGQEVVLTDGFVVENGSAMWAYIQGCSQARVDSSFSRPVQVGNSSLPPQKTTPKKKKPVNKPTALVRQKK